MSIKATHIPGRNITFVLAEDSHSSAVVDPQFIRNRYPRVELRVLTYSGAHDTRVDDVDDVTGDHEVNGPRDVSSEGSQLNLVLVGLTVWCWNLIMNKVEYEQ